MASLSSKPDSIRESAQLDHLVMLVAGKVAAGEAIDLDLLTADCPEQREQLEMLLPTLEAIADLGLSVSLGGTNQLPTGASPSLPTATGVLGDFRILREIGRGGMGIVYEAEQLSLGRRVALKVLPLASLLDERQLRRFKNEARAAAMLRHPNIVSIHAVGCERSVHFYAMDLIDGHDLSEVIRDVHARQLDAAANPESETSPIAKLSTQRSDRPGEFHRAVARLGAQAAEALHFAHQEGVVHRDIKPANLLLDRDSQIHIGDFGLARVRGDEDLTMTGDLIGTVRYMSPEQISSEVIVDARTDVYSLGLTLYELVAGRPAFDATSRASLLRQITESSPIRLKKLADNIPADLETIIETAMAKNADERYRTAAELADDLHRFQQRRSIRARRPTALQRAMRFAHRNPLATSLAAVICSLLVLLAITSSLAAFGFRKEALTKLQSLRDSQTLALRQEVGLYARDMRLAKTQIDAGSVLEAEQTLLSWVPSDGERDHRGFEWCYLWAAVHNGAPVHSFRFNMPAYSVAYLPDRQELAIGGFIPQVVTYPLNDDRPGARRLRLSGDAVLPEVYCVASSGDHLLTVGRGGSLATWELETGAFVTHQAIGHSVTVRSMAISQDGRYVAMGVNRISDGAVLVWDRQGEKLDELVAGFRGTGLVAFGPDQTLIFGSRNSTRIESFAINDSGQWQPMSNSIELENAANVVRGTSQLGALVAFPDRDLLALTRLQRFDDTKASCLEVWRWSQQTRLAKIPLDDTLPRALACSKDGKSLAVGSYAGNGFLVTIAELNGGERFEFSLAKRPIHQEAVMDLCFVGDDQIASAGGDGIVHLWEVESWRHQASHCRSLVGVGPGVTYVKFVSNSVLATANRSKVALWNVDTGEPLRTVFEGLGDFTMSLIDANPALEQLAILLTHWPPADKPGRVIVWDAARQQEHSRYDLPINAVCKDPALSPDGDYLAVVADGRVVIIDLVRKEERCSLEFAKHAVAVRFSHDSKRLAVGCWDGTTRLFNVPDFVEQKKLKSDKFGIVRLAFTPSDGALAAYGFGDRKIFLVDPLQGTLNDEFQPTEQYTTALTFSPAGDRLLTAGVDGKLRLWMTDAWEEVLQFPVGGWTFADVSPDGQTIAVGARDDVWVLQAGGADELLKLPVEELEAASCTTLAK